MFMVRGGSLEEVKVRIADHESRGAVLVGEIKEEYFQSKEFKDVDYRNLLEFRENYDKSSFTAVMQKAHVEREQRAKRWY